MDILVLGLAGASGVGGERAAEALKRGFRPWSKLLTTAPELVAAALRPVEPDLGQALRRAERLIAGVRRLAARSGGLGLDFLTELPAQEAWDWLEDALGLPPPLIASILTCGPIRHRVAHPSPAALRAMARLGLIEDGVEAQAAGLALKQNLPATWTGVDLAELSALLHSLGDSLCHETRPECGACPATGFCPSAPTSPSRPAGPLTYLRRRIAFLEGRRSRTDPVAGLQLGGEAFASAVFPHGFPCGAHQAAPGAAGQGAPLILAVACALAMERRNRAAPSAERPGRRRLLRRNPPPPEPASGVSLLLVQEIDSVLEQGEVYPPGLKALGLDPQHAACVTVGSGGEVLRVVDEALKLKAAPVLVAELRRGAGLVDLARTRRLNLAARRAGAVLVLVTPDLDQTSAVLTRWRIGSASSRATDRRLGAPAFTLDLVRNRLGPIGAWTVEWDSDEQRFRTPEPFSASSIGHGPRPLPTPQLPPPVDRPAVAGEAGRVAA